MVMAAKVGNRFLQGPNCVIDATKFLSHRLLQTKMGGLRDVGIMVEAHWITLLVVVEWIPTSILRTRTLAVPFPSHLKYSK